MGTGDLRTVPPEDSSPPPHGGLAATLAVLARQLDALNGEGRSAAVWALEGEPRLLYAGPHARKHVLEEATRRLTQGEGTFEVQAEPGVRGKVVVCINGPERAAYGLFLHGAGQPHLGQTLEQLIAAAERSFGRPVSELSRVEKQQVVRFLDQRGAFLLRRAVEEVADRLGVTRFTIYNYLDRRD